MKFNKLLPIIIIITFICIFFLLGIKDNNVQSVKVLITPPPGKDHCIIEVKADGILKITSGDLSIKVPQSNLDSESFFQEDAKIKQKRLTKADCREINELIDAVKNENKIYELSNIYDDASLIFVVIDGIKHETIYDYKFEKYGMNEEPSNLQKLVYKLVQIAPVKSAKPAKVDPLSHLWEIPKD